jgi:ABC-type molybdate transport system substrate-binding protein
MENVMLKRLLLLCAAVAAVVGVDARGAVADAAEVKVLTSVALTVALNELAPRFEKATGDFLTGPEAAPTLKAKGFEPR